MTDSEISSLNHVIASLTQAETKNSGQGRPFEEALSGAQGKEEWEKAMWRDPTIKLGGNS